MADAPSGPSVLSHYPGAGLALPPGDEQEDGEEEEEGRYEPRRGHHLHRRHHQQLNGSSAPDLRHIKALKSKLPPPLHDERTGAPNGLERLQDREEALLASRMGACGLHPGDGSIRYVRYESELQMPDIMRLITKDLSEPYSIYTYRYFIHNWPQLCFLAMVEEECVGAIVCKLDMHKKMFRRGYIAMLAVDSKYRRKGIGTNLVKKAIYAMVEGDCDEVVLETEITNKSALKLYENLGFVRDKRLFRYYLNGVDALRLKLWLR
ncbi:LOW QUALITY PROTEIN: N-alpha-acetyltransferase 30 [Bufo gargarizans]|uniref:LOW QUALITY PROTEIN: N-alpha-acetyltransferase 30 n=1 Tax=Bufo gargarizans TaxID=30331 RepID=UPI001CF42BEF|nr:LOW QUALITY PROTEIN: N-alpha-acetyltransferase 30 [Bufo gargarizans]